MKIDTQKKFLICYDNISFTLPLFKKSLFKVKQWVVRKLDTKTETFLEYPRNRSPQQL